MVMAPCPTCAHQSPVSDELLRLRAFARRVLQAWPEGDLDGGELQEAAVAAQLLVPHTVTTPCGENCGCADFHGSADMAEGVNCYRRAPTLRPGAPC